MKEPTESTMDRQRNFWKLPTWPEIHTTEFGYAVIKRYLYGLANQTKKSGCNRVQGCSYLGGGVTPQ